MRATVYAKQQIQQVFGLLGKTLDDLDDAQYNWSPGGTANSAAKSHVHLLSALDLFLNGILKRQPPSWPEVAKATGLPENALEVWGSDRQIPIGAMRAYAEDVQQQVLDYVDALSDDDLELEVDTRMFGKQTVAWVLQLAVTHSAGHMGDISAVKGMQGLKGLPF